MEIKIPISKSLQNLWLQLQCGGFREKAHAHMSDHPWETHQFYPFPTCVFRLRQSVVASVGFHFFSVPLRGGNRQGA